MRRTRSSNNTATKPAVVNESSPGYYVNRDVGGGVAGTIIDADELNIVQEEIVAIATLRTGTSLDDAGASTSQAADNLDAIRALRAGAHTKPGGLAVDTDCELTACALASTNVGPRDGTYPGGVSVGSTSVAIDSGAVVACLDASQLGSYTGQFATTESGIQAGTGTCYAVAAVASSSVIVSDGSESGAGLRNVLVAASLGGGVSVTGSSDEIHEVAVLASYNANIEGPLAAQTALIACDTVTANRGGSALVACRSTTHPSGGASDVVVIASKNLDTTTGTSAPAGSVCGGYNASAGGQTWRIEGSTGSIYSDGTVGAGAADVAELFENLAPGVIEPGVFVNRAGRKVTTGPGRPLGIVSVKPALLGNDSPMGWAGRYLTDALGRRTGVAPGYDPTAPQVPRSQRPEEWTAVALLGQVRARVGERVAVDDYLEGVGGIGMKAAGVTRFECLEIVSSYDAARGYAVALVLVR